MCQALDYMRVRKMVWPGERAGDKHSPISIPRNIQLQIVACAMKEKDCKVTWQGLTPRRWHLSWELNSETGWECQAEKESICSQENGTCKCPAAEQNPPYHTFRGLKEVPGVAGWICPVKDGDGGRAQVIQGSVACWGIWILFRNNWKSWRLLGTEVTWSIFACVLGFG